MEGGSNADFWCLDYGSEKFYSRLPTAEVGRFLKDIAPMFRKVSGWNSRTIVKFMHVCWTMTWQNLGVNFLAPFSSEEQLSSNF